MRRDAARRRAGASAASAAQTIASAMQRGDQHVEVGELGAGEEERHRRQDQRAGVGERRAGAAARISP